MKQLRLDKHGSPIGTIWLVTDAAGALVALDFEDHEARLRQLLRLQHGPVALSEGGTPANIAQALEAYFDGDASWLAHIPRASRGTDFQRLVWHALMDIPAGQTESYGQLARRIGRPGASRAVGLANGANPIAIVVPCHRVIGASGALTGYGGGMWRKQWLLAHEQALRPGLFAAA